MVTARRRRSSARLPFAAPCPCAGVGGGPGPYMAAVVGPISNHRPTPSGHANAELEGQHASAPVTERLVGLAPIAVSSATRHGT